MRFYCLSIWTVRNTVSLSPSGGVTQGKEGYSKVFLIVISTHVFTASLNTWFLYLERNLTQMSSETNISHQNHDEKVLSSEKSIFEIYAFHHHCGPQYSSPKFD